MGQYTTEREDLKPEIYEAGTDPVTGLPDSSQWELRLAQEMLAAGRSAQPLCVAVVDLDNNLKAVNDEHGRLAGDSLLRRAADSWVRSIRSTDALLRLDAHTFGVLLPDCTLCTADRVMARMREAMPEGQSFSAGVAQLDGGDTTTELIERAYDALHSAKRHGRACTQIAGMPEQFETEAAVTH